MTWEELKQEAEKMGYYVVDKFPWDRPCECISNNVYGFYKDGTVETNCQLDDLCGEPFAYKRTHDQMYQIMKALQQEE